MVATLGLLLLGLSVPAAQAETTPPPGTPATVAADPLPTWQVNGVVWAQAIVGNTVYVAGNFTAARPPGVAAGGAGEVPAAYAFAYDITTGNRIASFSPQFNAQTNSVAVSPDGSRVYFGGDFTTVNGITRNHIAAFDTASNTLSTSFAPVVGSRVTTIAVSSTSVYAGGWFKQVVSGGALVNRSYFAAFNPSNGALLPWAPVANDSATAMVIAPDGSRVILGGHFATLNGVDAYGMGSVDSSTGTTTLPWAANQRIRDAGVNGAIDSLRTDGKQIFGSGWAYGDGASFEGTFGADPYTGAINFVNDCHGDTYDVLPVGQVLYSASHVHSCEWIGAFKNTNPWTFHWGSAFSTVPSGVGTGPDDYGWDYSGLPTSSVLHFFPLLQPGTFTGQNQAGWSLTGNSSYVAYGGEFPSVNGVAQQGLTRYAVTSIAPNKQGPVSSSVIAPSALSIQPGAVRLSWPAAWDRDNSTLTYAVYRDNAANPFYTTTATSNFWTLPAMHTVDTGLANGSTHTYKLKVSDPFGNSSTVTSASVTVTSTALPQYSQDVIGDGALDYWRLGEPSGSVANDYAGYTNLSLGSGVGHGAAGAIGGDSNAASTFDGTANGVGIASAPVDGPNTFSAEAWFKTTTTTGGKIVGFGNANSGDSGNYDRHVYMDNAGHVIFGVYNNGVFTVQSTGTYNDGQYHHVVATLSSSGLALYIDGKKVGTNGGTSVGQAYSGYWRVGEDNLNGWTNQPTSTAFAGTIDDVAIYPTALSITQVQKHYLDSGRTLNLPAVPTDSYGKAVYNLQPDIFWRLDDASGTTAADTSPNGNDGTYAGGFSLGQNSPVAGATGKAVAFNGSDGTIGSVNAFASPSTYTESAWFKTSTTSGGKIIGFGDQQSGLSGNYDRHVYMEDSGQLTFGTWTGQTNTTTTSASYNDGAWHQVVATQGADGMKLYVDGQLVGTNAQTQAQPYTGYWRVGGDSDWGGSSAFLNGTIDEVAIWGSTVLTGTQVQALYKASPIASNVAPTAVISSSACANLVCTFGSTGSNDPDGTIASYAWDFGDGTSSTQAAPSHTYAAAGTYTVKLTVTDNQGATGVTTASATPTAPANQPPVAVISTSSCTNLSCAFGSAGSNDPDGSIASYAWDFGDGTTSSQQTPFKNYASAGTYTVKLTVTDNLGATGSTSVSVTVAAANQSPTAVISPKSCTNLACTFGSSGSVDPDGSIASYAWDFGDGTTSTLATPPVHTYLADGTYTVKLTVTDNLGATGTSSTTVTVAANKVPVAAIAKSCTNLVCSFDGSSSNDPDGSITSYAWSFGDGTSSTLATPPAHTYASAGTYTVKLTVTDNQSATGSTTTSVTVAAANQSPTAVISPKSCTNLVCTFGSAGSVDPDGSIVGYAWDFGDGTTSTLATPPAHTYPSDGSYTVKLTVTDNQGATGTTSTTVTVAANKSPVAVISSSSCANLVCTFGSAGSNDPDGSIASYAWDFGDGTSSTLATPPAHTYASAGSYTVKLTVTDNQGATGSTTATAVATAGNQSPTAVISPKSCTNLVCTFGSSGSSDPDGTIASYAWDFGDSTSSTLATPPAHTYASPGTYTVKLTVTDNLGATGSTTTSVTVAAANQAPTAVISPKSCTNLVCTFGSASSTDPDGTIASVAWTFGDGTSSTAVAPTKTYAAAGTYTVTLTVTDNLGATGSTSTSVTVTAPPFYAQDAFTRVVASGWGTADLGGAWTTSAASSFAVSGGVGTLTLKPGNGPSIYLNTVSSSSTDMQVSISANKVATGGGIYANVTARRVAAAGEYRAKARITPTGAVAVSLVSVSTTGAETTLKSEVVVPGLTLTPGQQLRIRFQATGTSPTTLRVKVWKVGAAEPTAWTLTTTDSTAGLQTAGSVGLMGYLSSTATNSPVVVSYDNVQAGPAN